MSLQPLDRRLWPQVGMVLTYVVGWEPYGVGTATLIHPGAVLTAAHVVAPGDGATVDRFDVILNDGTEVRGIPPVNACVRDEWEGPGDRPSPFDYGVLLLGTRLTTPHAAVVPTRPHQLRQKSLSVVGFPGEGPDFGRFLGGTDVGRDSLMTAENAYSIQYPIPTVGGMSGGPVYFWSDAGGMLVRGVHTSLLTNNDANGLVIHSDIDAQIQEWLRWA